MDRKHILVIEDISLVGRCSLTAALPLFTACGMEATALPTALLSSHTGGFGQVHRRDLTQDMAAILAHWREIPLHFDAIHVGYLAGAHQLPQVMEAVQRYHAADTLLFVDPVMGDWGKRYSFLDDSLLAGFRWLAARADLVMPNRTEAALLLDEPYQKGADSPDKLLRQLRALQGLGCSAALVTGISGGDGHQGAAYLAPGMSAPGVSLSPQLEGSWPGTGDIFATVLEAVLLLGGDIHRAVPLAVQFVYRCLRQADSAPLKARFGLPFEQQIPWLLQQLPAKESQAG